MTPRRHQSCLLAFIAMAAAASVGLACRPHARAFEPREGDLLFQDLDSGPLCKAIERVTKGYAGWNLSHVGIVGRAEGAPPLVIEAMPGGVRATLLSDFLVRSRDADGRPKVVVGRLRLGHRRLAARAVDAATGLLGKPYDDVFAIGNDRYYCSELIYEALRIVNGGEPLFDLAPMTFKDPATGATDPVWADYFQKLGIPIPEGKPGINPGSLSRSPKIEIIYAYGEPSHR